MNVLAKIENLEYQPFLCKTLPLFQMPVITNGTAFENAAFTLEVANERMAVSHWVSPKRTRSYPFARIYDTMQSKIRITIIPLVKDEGKDGDRDYLQWDTISLMSLLGVHVIIAYYKTASKSERYANKITDQEFDYLFIQKKIEELILYKQDALHWNLKQVSELHQIASKCEAAYYEEISPFCHVELHSRETFRERVQEITVKAETFKKTSRILAKEAQHRESVTEQPKERVGTGKGKITITNYIGGKYFFTTDEMKQVNKTLFLIEKKHSSTHIPNLADIKDGLIKMMLYANLSSASVNGSQCKVQAVLGLTSDSFVDWCVNLAQLENYKNKLSKSDFETLQKLFQEGSRNNFLVFLMGASKQELEKSFLEAIS